MRDGLALAVFVACTAAPRLVLAQPTAAILGLHSEPGGEEQARALTDALRSQGETVQAWSLSATSASIDQMTMAHDCDASAPECLDLVTGALGVEQLVVGSVSAADGGAPRVELRLFVREKKEVTASASADLPEGAVIDEVAVDLLRQLGVLAAAAEPETVAAEPAAAVPVEEPAPVDEAPASLDWLGYLLVGVAIASTGGAVFSWVQIDQASSNESFETYRRRVGEQMPTSGDVCTLADDGYMPAGFDGDLSDVKNQCSVGATFEVLQYVFLGSALLTGGIGAYVLLSGGGDEAAAGSPGGRAALAVRPRLGRQSAGVSATLRF